MSKRIYSWLGGGENIEPMTDGDTSVSEVIQMVPAYQTTEISGGRTDFLIEAIYLHFSIHRLLISELDAAGFVVWQAAVSESSNNPAQALDSLSLQDRAYGNKSIMMMAPLPVPKTALSGDLLSATVTQEVLVAHHEYQAMRKHDRANQILCLAVNSDLSVVLSVFCQWRVLVSWGKS